MPKSSTINDLNIPKKITRTPDTLYHMDNPLYTWSRSDPGPWSNRQTMVPRPWSNGLTMDQGYGPQITVDYIPRIS